MAEFTSAEKVNIGYENEYSTDAMTGGPDKRRQLYYQLIQSMKKAESVDIIVSFLMESGVRMLLKELEHTLKRGAKIRILTGNYLGITQPSALYLIKRKLGDRPAKICQVESQKLFKVFLGMKNRLHPGGDFCAKGTTNLQTTCPIPANR